MGVKTKMSALDVKASVAEMQQLIGLRLLNVYDINAKVMLLKFGHGDSKRHVLIESGVRIHLTTLNREKPKMPSQFTFKIRKHVKSWRVDSIVALGGDRTVVFRFGTETTCFHLIVELYARGNIVLADHDFVILMLLRTHREGDVQLAVRETYPTAALTQAATAGKSDDDGRRAASSSTTGDSEIASVGAASTNPGEDASGHRLAEVRAELETAFAQLTQKAQALKGIVAAVEGLGPQLAEHALLCSGLNPDEKVGRVSMSSACLDALAVAVEGALELLHSPKPLPPGGWLIKYHKTAQPPASSAQTAELSQDATRFEVPAQSEANRTALQLEGIAYDDFAPVSLRQFDGTLATQRSSASSTVTTPPEIKVFKPSFGEVCDHYFFRFEMDKVEQHNDKKGVTAVAAKERFLQDHARRIRQLESEEEKNMRKGQALEANAASVDQVIELLNMLLGMKLGWDKIRILIKARQAEGHPVAYMIHEVHFERNSATVLLEDNDLAEDEEDNNVPPMAVEVDLSMNAQRNACRYFSMKKQVHTKLEKTVAATDKAAAAAERKGQRQAAKQGAVKKEVLISRRSMWFEKFFWFLTSAGDLVVAGRDNQQTGMLVSRYMSAPTDVFVSCDAPKTLPCIVKCRNFSASEVASAPQQVALISIQEAGAACVARSSAWESKQSISAWWVPASCVAPNSAGCGVHTHPGMFLSSGERHYLKPMPLTLSCAILFRLGVAYDPPDQEEYVTLPEPPLQPPAKDDPASEVDEHAAASNFPSAAAAAAATLIATTSVPPSVSSNASPETSLGKKKVALSMKTLAQRSSSGSGAATPPSRGSGHGANASSRGCSQPDTASDDTRSASQRSSQQAAAQAAMNRRLQHKLKKIQKRYGEQDEEERMQRMQIIGNRPSKVHKLLRSDGAPRQRDDEEGENNGSSSSSASETDDDGDGGTLPDSANNAQGRGGGALPPQQRKEVRFSSVVKTDGGAGAVGPNSAGRAASSSAFQLDGGKLREQCAQDMDELRYFHLSPPSDGVAQYAVIICCPTSAALACRYRLELSVGSEKKGAAAQSILRHFTQAAAADELLHATQKAAVAHLDCETLQNQLPGSLKVHYPASKTDRLRPSAVTTRRVVQSTSSRIEQSTKAKHADPSGEGDAPKSC